jgi:hypothetical protein
MHPSGCVLKLASELFQVNAVLGCLFSTNINYRNVATEALHQRGIALNINFAKGRAEFAQKRSNRCFSFLAQMATNFAIQRHVWSRVRLCRYAGRSFWSQFTHDLVAGQCIHASYPLPAAGCESADK